MYDGTTLWKPMFSSDMESVTYNGLPYNVFRNVPENLYAALHQTVKRFPNKTFLVDDDGTTVTFAAFLKMVDTFAAYLRHKENVKAGDHVALMLYNCREFCIAFLSLCKIGAVTLPIPSKFKKQEVLALLDKSDPAAVICDTQFAPWMEGCKEKRVSVLISDGGPGKYGFDRYLKDFTPSDEAASADVQAKDPAILMFTSGTTSLSKGVVLDHFNIMNAVEAYRQTLAITPEDSCIIAVPIYHVTGMIALFSLFLYVGGTVYLHRIFNAKRVLQTVLDENVTFIHGSPTVFYMMMAQKPDFPPLPSLRMVACGSSYMPKEKIKAFHGLFPTTAFRTVYGMTETSSPATVFPCDAAQSEHIGSCGLPIPGTTFRAVDEQGNELPAGEIGEVQLKGSVVLQEYYRLNTPALSADGWLSTGDLGYFTDTGYLFLVDRKKDMINRGGEKICSYDVENELYRIDGVEEAAVVGIPDPVYGEVAAAAIKRREGSQLSAEDIHAALVNRLAKYKIPAKILFIDEIPVNPSGKPNKREIRSMFPL